MKTLTRAKRAELLSGLHYFSGNTLVRDENISFQKETFFS